MKLYTLVHVHDHSGHGITSGGIKLKAFTNKLDAENEMYKQLDETYGQMDQDDYDSIFNDNFGFAYIRHLDDNRWVYDHEWRIVTL